MTSIADTAAPAAHLDAEELAQAITRLMYTTSPAVFTARVPEALCACPRCGVAAGQPCLPFAGRNREQRAIRNHAPHRPRRAAAARIIANLVIRQAQAGTER